MSAIVDELEKLLGGRESVGKILSGECFVTVSEVHFSIAAMTRSAGQKLPGGMAVLNHEAPYRVIKSLFAKYEVRPMTPNEAVAYFRSSIRRNMYVIAIQDGEIFQYSVGEGGTSALVSRSGLIDERLFRAGTNFAVFQDVLPEQIPLDSSFRTSVSSQLSKES